MSRRGLMPRRHATVSSQPSGHSPLLTSLTGLTRFLRTEARRAMQAGGELQSIIDELRPFIADMWEAMALPDRGRFLRHARPWWDVHRHRMAAQVADRIDAARASGQLSVSAGRVRDDEVQDGQVMVTYTPRGQDRTDAIRVVQVINCAGLGADYERASDPLIRTLLRDGMVRPDPLRLGLDVTSDCALLDKDGAVSRRLFAVGPVTKGTF